MICVYRCLIWVWRPAAAHDGAAPASPSQVTALNVKVYSVAGGCGPLIVQVPLTGQVPWSPLCVQVADGCGALALHIMPRYVLYNMMGEIKYKQQVGWICRALCTKMWQQ